MWYNRFIKDDTYICMCTKNHRNIRTLRFTAEAIEDIIERCDPRDWLELIFAIHHSKRIAKRAKKVCEKYDYYQKNLYDFWLEYINTFIAKRKNNGKLG